MEWADRKFPPTEADEVRLLRYDRFQLLFEGDHARAFEHLSAFTPYGRRRRIIYLTANYAGLISKLAADLLFSERPVFVLPDSASQAQADRLARDNDLFTGLYESALSTSFRGDGVFRVRVGKRHASDAEESVIIEEIPAYSYFVQSDPDNVRTVQQEAIAWVHVKDRQAFLRVQEHEPGLIRERAFTYSPTTQKVGGEVPLSAVYGADAPPAVQETGISRSCLVHVPNMRHSARLWGMSDYQDLESLFDAINNRLSKTDAILDRHAQPKLALPPGVIDDRGNVKLSDIEVFEGDPAYLSNLPRYITWDAKLEAAFQHLEVLLDQIFRLAEISPAAFGLDKAGSIESGRAMRMRFIRTQAKIARKRSYYDAAIRRLFSIAQEFDSVYFGGPAPAELSILWQDGIPDDMVEMVDVESRRVEAGLSSRMTSLQRLDKLTEDQARAEIVRMSAEATDPARAGQGVSEGAEAENFGQSLGTYPGA